MTNPDKPIRLGLISALHEEQAGLIEAMHGARKTSHGMRDYVRGNLFGIDCVCVLSRIGKVAAATTAAMLIERFDVTHIIFTGVAGSADPAVRVGDIVIADTLVQHDMNAAPLFPRFEVPLTGLSRFASHRGMSDRMAKAAADFIENDFAGALDDDARRAFGLLAPRVHRGLIASGDEFITSRDKLAGLQSALAGLLAVEMEGAAVAQVSFEMGRPFAVVRTISDNANENAAVDFTRFVEQVAARYAFSIVQRWCEMAQ